MLRFCNNRNDLLDSLPPAPAASIIFLGNSITHMMEWRELFGDRSDIINRGVSGAHTYEVAEHLDNMLGESPSKVFLMIGTNESVPFLNLPLSREYIKKSKLSKYLIPEKLL